MAANTQRIVLITHGMTGYKVKKLTNTIMYTIGSILPREEVQALCDDEAWDVTIQEK